MLGKNVPRSALPATLSVGQTQSLDGMASPAEDVRVCLPNGLVLEGLAWGPVGSKCRVLALHGERAWPQAARAPVCASARAIPFSDPAILPPRPAGWLDNCASEPRWMQVACAVAWPVGLHVRRPTNIPCGTTPWPHGSAQARPALRRPPQHGTSWLLHWPPVGLAWSPSTLPGTVARRTARPMRPTLASATRRTRLLPSSPWVRGVPLRRGHMLA